MLPENKRKPWLRIGNIHDGLVHAATIAAGHVVALLASASPLPAHALQLIEASDGVSVEAILSIKEPTRIRIENAPITDVFGNIHSSNCADTPSAVPTAPAAGTPNPSAVNDSGEIVLECDRGKGEIYIKPVADSQKPVNLFVSSASATYTLLLRPSDTPADTIVIRDKTPPQLRAKASGGRDNARQGPAANHIRTMKALLVAMASDRVPPDIEVEDTKRDVPLWSEARFSLLRQYEGRGYLGEKYLLENVSGSVMVLTEQEFDRERGQVAGIAIEHHNLRPGDTTHVFVIRKGADQ